jgi:hypothetical protein
MMDHDQIRRTVHRATIPITGVIDRSGPIRNRVVGVAAKRAAIAMVQSLNATKLSMEWSTCPTAYGPVMTRSWNRSCRPTSRMGIQRK